MSSTRRARWIMAGVVCASALSLSAECSAQSVADAFIRGAEAGMRAREQEATLEVLQLQREALKLYYQQQLETLRNQNRLLELQAKQLAEATRAAQAPSAMLSAQADAETRRILLAFSLRHPDWHQYEPAMLTYAQRLPPGQLDVVDYLDALYLLARRDIADATLKQVAEEHTAALLVTFTTAYPDWHRYEQRMLDLMKMIEQPVSASDYEYLALLYRAARATP